MHIQILSIFPELFEPYMSTSMMGRARNMGVLSFEAHNLRDWTHDVHRTVDDEPFGGAQGMLMKPEPFFEAFDDLFARQSKKPHVVFFTPRGQTFTQKSAERLASHDELLFVCGRYEGIDQRVFEFADECISLGDYVLTGGELAALVVIDAIVRLLPGVLGNKLSAVDESFSSQLLECDQYTRPALYRGREVPEVLRSGHHEKIEAWQRANALATTMRLRPDLLEHAELSPGDYKILQELADKQGRHDG